MVKARQADAVIAHRVDRIARDSFFARLAARTWLESGIEVHTCDIGRIEDDNNIVFLVFGWQGHEDRKKIIANTRRGRYTKASQGEVVGGGRSPYGYHFAKDAKGKVICLEIFDPEAKTVRLIYCWYVYGDESGKPLSIYEITLKLSEMRIETPGESRRCRRVRAPGMWAYTQVSSILANETYAGVWHFGKYDGHGNAKANLRPLDEQVAVSVPAIVDRETWEQAQAQRGRNLKYARRNAKRDYLLREIIRCGCGRAMTGRFMGRFRYYHCCWRSSHVKSENVCNEKYVRADKAESAAYEYVKNLYADPVSFERRLRIAQKMEWDRQNPKRAELETVEAFIRQAENEIEEIATALRKARGKVGETLQAQQDKVNARHAEYIAHRDALIAELGERRLTDERIERALKLRGQIALGMENATDEDKRQLFEMLGVSVVVKDGEAKVTCLIPEELLSIDNKSSPTLETVLRNHRF